MAGYVDPLVVGRVIGDVVDLFVPTISMMVRYGLKHVNNGCDIKPSMAANPPSVQIAGRQSDLYTLVREAYFRGFACLFAEVNVSSFFFRHLNSSRKRDYRGIFWCAGND